MHETNAVTHTKAWTFRLSRSVPIQSGRACPSTTASAQSPPFCIRKPANSLEEREIRPMHTASNQLARPLNCTSDLMSQDPVSAPKCAVQVPRGASVPKQLWNAQLQQVLHNTKEKGRRLAASLVSERQSYGALEPRIKQAITYAFCAAPYTAVDISLLDITIAVIARKCG